MSEATDTSRGPLAPGHCNRRHLVVAMLMAPLLGCNALSILRQDPLPVKVEPEQEAAPNTPGKYSLRVAPCIFFTDFELKRDDPIFAELASLPEQVYRELHLTPRDAVVQVYLFEDEKKYHAYMRKKDPNLPERRAYFVEERRYMGTQNELKVYTFWGDRVQQDLRHEVTHGLLHAVLRKVPIWLDEGLAEYFELPTRSNGLNSKHVGTLRRDLGRGMQLNLARLESLQEVSEMRQPEYRESWAWVYMMMHGKPTVKAVFLDYIKSLRSTDVPPPLAPKLAAVLPSPEDALTRELASLDEIATAQVTARKSGGWFGDHR